MKIYTEKDAEDFLKKYLPVARSILTKKQDAANRFAKSIGYPVVLKIISKQALHKTEIGGVKIAKDEKELEEGFDALMKISKTKKIKIDGILVQEFVQGQETIIGIKKDDAFGHVLLFGTGGILVEVIKDVSFRVCPITESDAESMINELKGKKLLEGYRGKKPANKAFLKKILVKVSLIPKKHKNIQEMDINPFIINEKTGKIADARIVFE